MAYIWVQGHNVPLVFLVVDGKCTKVMTHFLHIYFKLVESSIYIEEEKWSKLGKLEQSISIVICKDLGRRRALLLPSSYEL